MSSSTGKRIAVDVAMFVVSNVAFFYAFKYVMAQMDPTKAKSKESQLKSKKNLERLGTSLKVSELELTEHEAIIAAEVIAPEDITQRFEDIGGLDHVVEDLQETVIAPLKFPQLFASSAAGLYAAPKGVLLYGPPGCGKTLLAKGLAKESGATFINMKASILQDKWFGESNKLVSALFSLARKLQPTIIFIDEIDSFLRERSRNDHEISALVKTEFMSSWDGLTTGEDTQILVLGATNRQDDIDSAVLRRMPKRFYIRLPDTSQRKSILSLMLRDIQLDSSLDVDMLALATQGYSGSGLKELCRTAVSVPVREQMKRLKGKTTAELQAQKQEGIKLRPLKFSDFGLNRHDLD